MWLPLTKKINDFSVSYIFLVIPHAYKNLTTRNSFGSSKEVESLWQILLLAIATCMVHVL